jgi:hypothetical protein
MHPGQVDGAHAAAAQRSQDLIGAKHQPLPHPFEELSRLKLGEVVLFNKVVGEPACVAAASCRGRSDEGIQLAPLEQTTAGECLKEAVDPRGRLDGGHEVHSQW